MSTKNTSRFMPLIIAISVVAGILIGTFYARHFAGNKLGIINSSSNKLNALLRVIDDQYVDTVNMTDLVEKAMPQILAELDPHSTYIPAQKLEEVNSELEGSFSGIGIQFTIQEDTIHVNSVIPGGPSEKVGLMAGDRIVMVNDSLFAGKGLTNEKAMRNLKGPKGSQVKLGVKRATEKELLDFTITRGDIPQNTIDAAYMLDDDYGYIQISKFGRTTHVELLNAIAQLSHEKCKGSIGIHTAEAAKGLGMHVIAYNRSQSQAAKDLGVEFVDLDGLFARSDVLALQMPLADFNVGIINKENIAKMKDGVIILNNSRGQMVVEQDLADALNSGKVAFAGLDVVSTEPIRADNPLLTAKNCIITPHMSWGSQGSRQRIMDCTVNNIRAFLSGAPENVVNP